MDDPADLARLADIVTPQPVAWLPPAPGWWILGAASLAALGLLAGVVVARHRRNAYRRAALAELAAIDAVDGPGGAAAVSAILKRAALVAYPRSETASLTGGAWQAFLARTAAMPDFVDGPAAGLAQAALGGPPTDGAAILAAARRWVRRHRGES